MHDLVFSLETLRLRLFVPDDRFAGEAAAYAVRNRAHHAPAAPIRQERYYSRESWAERLSGAPQRFRDGTSVELFMTSHDDPATIIGDCSFTNIVKGVFQACFLGYNLDIEHVGRGLMTEGLTTALGYAFSELGLHRVMANYVPTNARSGNVLRRLGFRVEGYARDYLLLDGKWQDHILTALLADDHRSGAR